MTTISKICEANSDNGHLLAKLLSHCSRKFLDVSNNARKVDMDGKQSACYDPETISLLRKTLDEAWDSLHPKQRAFTGRALLAEHILNLAATGERNPERLREAALMAAVAA